MCYEAAPRSLSFEASNTAVLEKDLLAHLRPAEGQPARKFLRNSGSKLIYILAATGPVMYVEADNASLPAVESNEYNRGDHYQKKFISDLATGVLIEQKPIVEPVQQAADTRPDRLAAAEADTGFKLGQKVYTLNGQLDDAGVVVGFARIDENGATGVRKVIVQETLTANRVIDASDLFAV